MFLLSLPGCGDDDDDDGIGVDAPVGPGIGDAAGGDAPSSGNAAVDVQTSRGSAGFQANCARCHGTDGTGTELAPGVIGSNGLPRNPPPDRVLRTMQFVTAGDVHDFARQNMPFDDPGSLPDQTYLDIVAFLVVANGVALDQPLSEENVDSVVINP